MLGATTVVLGMLLQTKKASKADFKAKTCFKNQTEFAASGTRCS